MTWAERVGDVATNVALVFINLVRVLTLLVRLAAEQLDRLITYLAERSETGIGAAETRVGTWVRVIFNVFLGAASVLLRLASVVTVLVRQVAVTVDEFFRILAEGEAAA